MWRNQRDRQAGRSGFSTNTMDSATQAAKRFNGTLVQSAAHTGSVCPQSARESTRMSHPSIHLIILKKKIYLRNVKQSIYLWNIRNMVSKNTNIFLRWYILSYVNGRGRCGEHLKVWFQHRGCGQRHTGGQVVQLHAMAESAQRTNISTQST